ncbi:MAG: type II toxin-antitoxin system RatA family toxin [bacterium]
MAQVNASTVIAAPIDDVYAAAKAVETFPEFMPDLESVEVLERSNGNTVSRWVGLVQGRKIRWVEEDLWDDRAYRCDFRQREGDFTRYQGTWRFEPVGEGTRTTIDVDFQLDIPLAGALLSNLLKVLMRKNIEGMLSALKTQVEARR